jgi:hypothetical protein
MDNREPVSLETCIRDLTTSAGKITIQNTIPPTAPDIIVRSGPARNTIFSYNFSEEISYIVFTFGEECNSWVLEKKEIPGPKQEEGRGKLGYYIMRNSVVHTVLL